MGLLDTYLLKMPCYFSLTQSQGCGGLGLVQTPYILRIVLGISLIKIALIDKSSKKPP